MASTDDFGLEPLHAIPARERAIQQIRRAINLGRFGPGDMLPPAADLARMLGVSRTTLLEAIAVLSDEGIIEVKRGRGGGIRVIQTAGTDATTRKHLRHNRQSIREIFDYRIALESMAGRLAALRRTKTDVERLRALMARLEDVLEREHSPRAFADFQDLDSRFHLAIAQASRNARLVNGIAEARAEMFLPVGAIFAKLEPTANELHAQIVDAIEEQDGEEAARLMAAHIDGTRASVERLLELRG